MNTPAQKRVRQIKDRGSFGVSVCVTPSVGSTFACRQSGLIHSEQAATDRFARDVAQAAFDESIYRISLCRYTSGKTELIDEWVRPNAAFGWKQLNEDRRAFDAKPKKVAA